MHIFIILVSEFLVLLTWLLLLAMLICTNTAVYFVRNYLGLYSRKVISTENSIQRLQNKKLNNTKCEFLGQIKLVRSSPNSPTPSSPLEGNV